jgi:RNA polymerase sigma-70 factor (ECF subfamily)
MSLSAVNAALHRGRARLCELAATPDGAPQATFAPADLERLSAYAAHFNAHVSKRIAPCRPMTSSSIRSAGRGCAAGPRCHAISAITPRRATGISCPGWLRAGRRCWSQPVGRFGARLFYFAGDTVAAIRDFRHAPCVIDGAAYQLSDY